MAIRLILGSVCLALALHAQSALAQEVDEQLTGADAEARGLGADAEARGLGTDARGLGTDAEARGLFIAGQVAFDEGRFESAVQYFLQAFRLSGRPELLYNIGNTYDRLQQPEQALPYFDQYLQQRPDAENRRQVEARVRLLRQTLEARQATTSAEPPPPSSAPAIPTPAETAQASASNPPATPATAPAAATATEERSGTSWVIWGGVGAVVIAAAVVAVVFASSGDTTQDPLVPRDGAPVVKL